MIFLSLRQMCEMVSNTFRPSYQIVAPFPRLLTWESSDEKARWLDEGEDGMGSVLPITCAL